MNITPDLIRRFPYAVNPSRISETMEALIGVDMAVAAKREGLPTATTNTGQELSLLKLARDEATVFRHIMAGARTIGHIRAKTNLDRSAIERALVSLQANGRVIRGPDMRASFTYLANPDYRPDEALQTLEGGQNDTAA